MKQKHYLFPAFCSAVLLTGPSLQANESDRDISSWDLNGDSQISLQEWDTSIEEQGVFDELDDNGNGIYDVDEAAEGYPEYDVAMDTDDGGHIERQEFTVGWFDSFDANDDDVLDESEFDQFSGSYAAGATVAN